MEELTSYRSIEIVLNVILMLGLDLFEFYALISLTAGAANY
ncbi:hypothetical protein [Burkholderia ubonensis]|nr:hypothetical protein [Burkholderia ubonensis]